MMDSESTPPGYNSMEYENNLDFIVQNQEDQLEQFNLESEFVPRILKIPNCVSLLQIIDDDKIEFDGFISHDESNESVMCFIKKVEKCTCEFDYSLRHDVVYITGSTLVEDFSLYHESTETNSNSTQKDEVNGSLDEPREGKILEIPETVGFIKLMSEDIIYDKVVTNNEKTLMVVLRINREEKSVEKKFERKSVDKSIFQYVKKHPKTSILFIFGCCASIGSIIFNIVMITITNLKMKSFEAEKQNYHNSTTTF
ncbi:hypothetical protein KGF54_005114 [Candida jiufengensis]|uniref:uncharacterized protein n=1 Tax=Candida jiufengensis TaxID=497108 RepID=UPI002224CED1|nr:uncharacterized protein KGF54_005114 [Candida jiufengensis]KAI5950498.1 hypothetical protein KGF54_005114 [Candida jiufengensis]